MIPFLILFKINGFLIKLVFAPTSCIVLIKNLFENINNRMEELIKLIDIKVDKIIVNNNK